MKIFAGLRLSHKFSLVLTGLLLLLFCVGNWVSYSLLKRILTERLTENLQTNVTGIRQTVETSASLAVRSYLRALAEQNRNTIEALHRRSTNGEIDQAEAQQRAKEVLLAQAIGSSGYIYVLNSRGRLVVHPHADVVGTDISEYAFAKSQMSRKNGFLDYEWKNPGESVPRKKILYMAYFAPWDWIISVTAYRDELSQLVDVTDFRGKIEAMTIGREGYPVVLNQQGEILVHPYLSGNVHDQDTANSKFLQRVIAAKTGSITYDWTEPRDGTVRQKIAVFSTIAEFGWLVAATGYVDDFYAPLHTLRLSFIALSVLTVLFSILVSTYLSRIIIAPLKALLADLSRQASRLDLPLPQSSTKNEIDELASYFKNYVHKLQASNQRLAELLTEQQRSALDLSIYKEVFDHIVEGISITNAEGLIVQTNPAFSAITGYAAAEAIGQNPKILKSGRHPAEFYSTIWTSIQSQGFWSGEIWNKRKNGEIYPERLTISAIRDKEGRITHYAAVFNDITQVVEQQERIHFLAYHDHLTKLPNRLLLLERMQQAVSACKRHGGVLVCMIIDLDNLKTVNDSIGHDTGDTLLRHFVERIQPTVRGEDTLGRMGGDEFVLIFHSPTAAIEDILPVINRLNEGVKEPFLLAEQLVYMTISIGIAIYPDDGLLTEDLLKRADLALAGAKHTTGNSYSFFSSEMEIEVKQRLHYLARIRSGLERGEFVPFFQPQIDLRSGAVIGMEALARWRSVGQLISPVHFIPISEQSGLIIPLAKQIYQQAFNETALLLAEGYALKLSVNLAPAQLQAKDFLSELTALRQESGLAAESIELEVTESSLMGDIEHSQRVLADLSRMGFSIAIDDFGTGYSSLQYLKQLPLHTLKIDMSFVRGIGRDPDDEKLIETIVLMARQFGLTIVAEGVEEGHQQEFLAGLGCHYGQGYLYGKPMDIVEFRAWLSLRRDVAGSTPNPVV